MTTENQPAPPPAPSSRPGWLPWAIAGLVVAILLTVVLLSCGGDDEGATSDVPALGTGKPELVSEEQLRAFGREQAVPVYWAGPRDDRRYELTRTEAGRIFVRYLPEGVAAGDPKPGYLTVGTYPGRNAYAALRTVARRPGTREPKTRSGALVVYDRDTPTSVYFAFPQQQFQVEVFSPQPGEARRLALDGQVAPVR